MTIADRIRTLDDTAATRLLAAASRPHMRAAGVETNLTPDLAAALGQAASGGPRPGAAPSDGDIARAALLLLADEPSTAPAIAALLDGPAPERFDIGLPAATAIVTLALVILQTHFRFKKDPKGKWEILIEKRPTSDSLLKSLASLVAKKALPLLPGHDDPGKDE